MYKKTNFSLIIFILFLLICAGCTGLGDDDNKYMTAGGNTVAFISDEEKGNAILKVVEHSPEDKYIGPEVPVIIRFNEGIKKDTIEDNVYIGDSQNTIVKCKFFFYDILDSPEISVELMILGRLDSGKQYYLNIGKNCESILGEKMTDSLKIPFIFSNRILVD